MSRPESNDRNLWRRYAETLERMLAEKTREAAWYRLRKAEAQDSKPPKRHKFPATHPRDPSGRALIKCTKCKEVRPLHGHVEDQPYCNLCYQRHRRALIKKDSEPGSLPPNLSPLGSPF